MYENDRAVGRLVQPTVDLVLLEHLDSIPQVSGPTYILSFSFSTWIPPPSRGSPARRLSLRVKEGSPYRVQVFSKSRQGTVAWPPSVYKFTGEKIYSAARFQQQFDNHRQRHHTVQQQQHTAAGASGDPLPDLAVLGLIKVSDGWPPFSYRHVFQIGMSNCEALQTVTVHASLARLLLHSLHLDAHDLLKNSDNLFDCFTSVS